MFVARGCSKFLPYNYFKLIRPTRLISAKFCTVPSDDVTSNKTDDSVVTPVKKGFAKAFQKYTTPQQENPIEAENQTFASLLKNSKFIDLGDPEGKVVSGKIYHVVEDDLYIDFGWKFHCICQRPVKNGSDYVRGAKVRLRIKELEMSTRFLGSEKDLTILESDCQLLGLISTPTKTSEKTTR